MEKYLASSRLMIAWIGCSSVSGIWNREMSIGSDAVPALGRSGSLDGFGQGTDHLVVTVGGAMEHVQTDSPPRQAHP